MSTLIEKLERALSGAAVQPMGFAAVVAKAPAAQMALVVALPRPEAELLPGLAKAGAEGVLVSAKPEAEFVTAAKEHRLSWGLRMDVARPQDVQALKDAGCDFVIYGPESPALVLDQTGVGQVLELGAAAAEELAGGIEPLAAGAIYVPLDDMPYLSVKRVILCQRLARMGRKPLLVQVHPAVADGELAALCDAGAAGVVVEERGGDATALVQRLRSAIGALPPRGKRAKSFKAQALLPRMHLVPTDADEGEPEEPGEDE